ncbi:MAG: methionyl-tRNA formyltransferase, partial [Gemmatimonadaceae bacterium]
MRVVFWGTPEFATPPLRALLGEGYDVVGVVTQPDKPQGRHRSTLTPPAVKVVALEEGIPVLQPEKPRGEEFLSALRELAPDISIVVAYGHILPRDVIDMPSLGTLNIHASLLPRWRGAAPIQASILAGDSETGITIMRMIPKLDAGAIVLQAPTPIPDDETFGELQLRLSELGAQALVEALTLMAFATPTERQQEEGDVTYAPKIEREHSRLDWSRRFDEISRAIRAYDPRPGAFTTLRGLEVKLYGARAAAGVTGDPGSVLQIDESGVLVACGQGAVRVGYVQPSGKRRRAALDF